MKLGVLMDPIASVKIEFDSTIAMLKAAAQQSWEVHYFTAHDLFNRNGISYGLMHKFELTSTGTAWFKLAQPHPKNLDELDLILMRKDPPVNNSYLYLTQLLAKTTAIVVNKPETLATANEKIISTLFPSCCPPTIITSNINLLQQFRQQEKDIVCKSMHAMGGAEVYHLLPQDPNANVIFDTLTRQESCAIMAQRFIPEIIFGDKRILLIGGEPVPFALHRIPTQGEWRGNMSVGAKPLAQPLTPRDLWICQQIGPYLRANGIHFAGIDIIGDYLTEINITSPTGIRELDEQCNLNIAEQLLTHLATLVNN